MLMDYMAEAITDLCTCSQLAISWYSRDSAYVRQGIMFTRLLCVPRWRGPAAISLQPLAVRNGRMPAAAPKKPIKRHQVRSCHLAPH